MGAVTRFFIVAVHNLSVKYIIFDTLVTVKKILKYILIEILQKLHRIYCICCSFSGNKMQSYICLDIKNEISTNVCV